MPLTTTVRGPRAKLVLAAAFAAMSQRAGVLAAMGSPKSAAFMGTPPLAFQKMRLGGHQRGPGLHRTMRSSSAACSAAAAAAAAVAGEVNEPVARQEPVRSEYHGFVRDDPYHWMKDDNWQQVLREPSVLRDDIRVHLDAENAYTESALAGTKDLQATMVAEMKGRMNQDESRVPAIDGEFAYFSRYAEGYEHPQRCRMSRSDFEGKWSQDAPQVESLEVLLDANSLAEGQDFFKLGGVEHSPDHKLLAYSTDVKGSEYFTVVVKDLSSGQLLQDTLVNCSSFEWAGDSQTLIYTVIDEKHREKWVYRHTLGSLQADDVLIFEEPDDGFFLGVGLTDSRRFITISSNDHQTSEVRLLDAAKPDAPLVLVQPRVSGLMYEVTDHGESLLVLTNHDKATDFKVCWTPLSTPGADHWKDLVPHKEGVFIRGMQTRQGRLLLSQRVAALPVLSVSTLSEPATTAEAPVMGDSVPIKFDEEAYSLSMMGTYQHSSQSIRFSYSSPTTPESVFDMDLATGERRLLKSQKVPSGHNADDYVCLRRLATAKDGAKVPVTILHRKATHMVTTLSLAMPSLVPSASQAPHVHRVYAIAHIRGGTDCGYAWYDPNGRMFNKMNTFTDFLAVAWKSLRGCVGDFLAVAKYLVDEKITSKGRIAIQGGSAGGML
ncbi:prolyl oligopeptidase, partial [Baffinella frigidus]